MYRASRQKQRNTFSLKELAFVELVFVFTNQLGRSDCQFNAFIDSYSGKGHTHRWPPRKVFEKNRRVLLLLFFVVVVVLNDSDCWNSIWLNKQTNKNKKEEGQKYIRIIVCWSTGPFDEQTTRQVPSEKVKNPEGRTTFYKRPLVDTAVFLTHLTCQMIFVKL